MQLPKVTFGIIVLNGEPFTHYNLRALYPFAHQIIVVEGASPVAAHVATPDGHSRDGTLEILRRFKAEEDTEDKVTIVTAEDHGYPNGFWPGEKDEQSQAYACRATGDWLWQVDVDEFYRQDDMRAICYFLTAQEPSVVFFYLRNFMYHHRLEVKGVNPEYCQSQPIARIFRWGEGYQYVTHRPPTVMNSEGENAKFIKPALAEFTQRQGWYIWHYPFLFRQQFAFKSLYYEKHGYRDGMVRWVGPAENMRRPQFAILWTGLSWLMPLKDSPPEPVLEMVDQHCDYALPGYLNQRPYRFLAVIVLGYLKILRLFRTRVRARRWFHNPYFFRHELRGSRESVVSQGWKRRVKDFLKKTRLFRLVRYLGVVGFKPY